MSTIKSSAENLTLNADGSGNDVLIQSNGSTKAIVTAEGNVGIGVTPSSNWHSTIEALTIANAKFSLYGDSANGFITNNVVSATNDTYVATGKSTLYVQTDGAHEFKVAASGSANANITWTKGFEVLNDGKARAKNGLLFGTDTAAANTLSDYESGSWTLGLNNVTAHGTCTFVSTYTKIGKVVTVSVYQTAGEISRTSTGGYFTGLPFTPSANSFGGGALIDGTPTKWVGLAIYPDTSLYLTGTFAQDNLRLYATYMTDS